MPTLLRWIESSRLYLLVFTLPYALMWSILPRSGGGLMVVIHALLVLFYGAHLDAAALSAGRDPALALFRGRERFDAGVVRGVRTLLAGALILSLIAMTIIQWQVGMFATGVFLCVALVAGRIYRPTARSASLFWPEITWPLFMLIVPALFIGAQAGAGSSSAAVGETVPAWSMPRPILGATVLGAVNLAAYALLCQVRDRAGGQRTLGDTVILLVLLFAAAMLGVWGVEAAWWRWPGAVIGAWGALLTIFTLAREHTGYAVGVWTLTSGGVGLALSLTSI